MSKVAVYGIVLAALTACGARAQDSPATTGSAATAGDVTAISPIFSQLVALSYPKDFKVAFEKSNGQGYIREAVPDGETVDRWSQMITVTGARGVAAIPGASPRSFLDHIASGFKTACPETFSNIPLGPLTLGPYDAFLTVTGCGTVNADPNKHSETAAIIGIKGSADMYTIQWAERGPASDKPIPLDKAKWPDRLKRLWPIRVCDRVPGEQAPFPSCLSH